MAPSRPGRSRSFAPRVEVLGAGLAPHLAALAARAVDHAGTLGGADVEDHQGLVDQRRTGDRPADRLDLAQAWVRRHMVARRAVATGQQALAHPGDHAVVLGVDADHLAVCARGVEHVEELRVLDAQPIVSEEDLERAVAGPRQRRQLVPQHLWSRVAQDHVERIVDHGTALGGHMIVLDHLGQARADMLRRERDHRRGAAHRRRTGGAGKIVRVHQARRSELLDMAVTVDAPWQQQPARGVQLDPARRQSLADRGDALATDRHLGWIDAGRGSDGAAADDEIVLGHGAGPPGPGNS